MMITNSLQNIDFVMPSNMTVYATNMTMQQKPGGRWQWVKDQTVWDNAIPLVLCTVLLLVLVGTLRKES